MCLLLLFIIVFALCGYCVAVSLAAGETQAAEREQIAEGTFENFPINIAIFRVVNDHHSPGWDVFFGIVWALGTGYVLVPILIILFFLRRYKIKVLLLTVLIETAIVQILKHVFMQPRPAKFLTDVHMLPGHELYGRSFPSGDTAMAFAIAAALLPGEPLWFKILLVCYGLLIGYERMYLGVHFPLDVITGILIGILSGAIVWSIFRRRKPSHTGKD